MGKIEMKITTRKKEKTKRRRQKQQAIMELIPKMNQPTSKQPTTAKAIHCASDRDAGWEWNDKCRLDAASRHHETQRAWRQRGNVPFFFFRASINFMKFLFRRLLFFSRCVGCLVLSSAATSITFHATRLSLLLLRLFSGWFDARARIGRGCAS